MSEVPTSSIPIPTADLTIPTMEPASGAPFDMGKYGFTEEEYPELAGKSEGEVLSFIVQALSQPAEVAEAPPPLPAPEPVKSDGFGAAWDYGSDNLQAMLGAGTKVLGQATGIETLEEYGQELQDKNEKEAEESLKRYDRIELEDASPGDNLTTFVIQTLGETLPSFGMAVGAGVIGATAAALVPAAAVTGTVGAGIAAFLPSALTITGEAQITAEQLSQDEDFESPGTMLLAGAAGGAIDTIALAIPTAKLLGKKILPTSEMTKFFVSKGVAPEVAEEAVKKGRQALKEAGDNPDLAAQNLVLEGRDAIKKLADNKAIRGRGTLRRAGAGARNQAFIEGATEAGQQAITTFAAETATGEEVEDYGYNLLDAAVRGGIAGSAPGAMVGALTGRSKADAEVEQERQDRLQESLTIDEANSSPDFDEQTSTVVSTEEKTVGNDTFIEVVEQDSESRVRTQRINVNDLAKVEQEEAAVATAVQEVAEEKENKGEPSEGTDLNNAGVLNREGLAFNLEDVDTDVEQQKDKASNLDQEITDLRSEITILERMRQLRARNVDPDADFQQLELDKDINITELIEQRKAKLEQYRTFLNSNNNKLKYKDAYKSITGDNKKLLEALDQELELDLTYLSDVEATIAGLEGGLEQGLMFGTEPASYLPSELKIQESLDKVGEIVNLEEESGSSVLNKLKAGRDRLSSGLSFDDSMTVDNLESFQQTFQRKFPKLMEAVDTEPVQKPILKVSVDPEVKEGVDSLAQVVGREFKNAVDKSRNDVDSLTKKLSLWSRFMASSYQQANKYPALKPLVRTMEEYNTVWRSIMNNAFMGRSLVYALGAENTAVYRRITELKNTVNQDISVSGIDGEKKLVLNLYDPKLKKDARTQLFGELNPLTGERTGEFTIIEEGKDKKIPALFKYKDIYGITTLTEEQYNRDYPTGELVLENIEGSPEQNKQTQLLIDAMEQEQETVKSLYKQAISAVINRTLNSFKTADTGMNSIKTLVESAGQAIVQERQTAGQDPLTEAGLAMAAMERVKEGLDQRTAMTGQTGRDTAQNVRDAKDLENYIETIGKLEEGRRAGYFPRSRTGDVIVRIIRTTYDPVADKNVEDVIHREDHITSFRQDTDDKKRNKITKTRGKELEKLIATTDGFNPATDKVKVELRNNENLMKASEMDNFFVLEAVMMSELDHSKKLSEEVKQESKKIFKLIAERIRAEKSAKGFSRHMRHRRNIPGAITPTNERSYHNTAWAQYVATLGRFVARERTEEQAQQIINNLSKEGNNVQKQGKELWENTKSPQGMASALKSVAFLGFLAGNISSSLLNLTQNFVTASILYGAYGKLHKLKTSKSAAAAGVLTTQYLMGSDIGFQAKDREAIAKTLHRLRAASSIEKGREMFDMLLELQERGIVGKINTEAMSSNADITSSQMVQKIFGGKAGALEKRLSDKQYRNLIKSAGVSKRLLDSVYAFSEIGNRINAALATFNAVEEFGLEGTVNPRTGKTSGGLVGFAKGTTSEGQITDKVSAATFVVNQSQFNLDAFNRPQIAFMGKGLGAITLQFLPFVTMMIEVYANAIGRYGGSNFRPIKGIQSRLSGGKEYSIDPRDMTPQGKRTLVYLLVPQLMMGGLFGLPFVDDLKEVYKLVAQTLNLQDSDVEIMFYEAITSIGGPDAYQTAEFFGRGAFKTYLGYDISQRVSLSPLKGSILPIFTDDKSLGELLGGPATAYIGQSIKGSADAFKRGDYAMAALKLLPFAGLQNVLKAVDASEAGVQTGAGRVIGGGMTSQNLLMMSMGFAPRPVYEDRDRMYRERYLNYKNSGVRKAYVNRAVRLRSQIDMTESAEEKGELYDELQDLYMEVYEHDLKADLEDKIDPNFTLSQNVNKRYMDDKLGRQSGVPTGTAKSTRISEEILGGNFGR